jgi:hypothetical protein
VGGGEDDGADDGVDGDVQDEGGEGHPDEQVTAKGRSHHLFTNRILSS